MIGILIGVFIGVVAAFLIAAIVPVHRGAGQYRVSNAPPLQVHDKPPLPPPAARQTDEPFAMVFHPSVIIEHPPPVIVPASAPSTDMPFS